MKKDLSLFRMVRRARSERGLSLLEYAAGATVLITIVYVGMTALGENIDAYLDAIGAWTQGEAAEIADNTQGS